MGRLSDKLVAFSDITHFPEYTEIVRKNMKLEETQTVTMWGLHMGSLLFKLPLFYYLLFDRLLLGVKLHAIMKPQNKGTVKQFIIRSIN